MQLLFFLWKPKYQKILYVREDPGGQHFEPQSQLCCYVTLDYFTVCASFPRL